MAAPARSKFTPTDEQAEIMTAVADPAGGSVMVEAFAGCAKSSTLELAAPGIRIPALAVAFNKSVATDLKPRLPDNFQVKTFNGLGYGAWMRANPGVKRWELDDRKLGKIISQIAKQRKTDLTSEQWDSARRLVSSAMQAGLTPGDIGEPLVPDTAASWEALCDGLWIDQQDSEFMIDLAKEALAVDIEMARQGTISFDDQIYCSATLGGKFTRYPVGFVDESQDLSPLNHYMLGHSLAENGRLIAVGDSRQAIYAFRGADAASMNNLRKLRQAWNDKKLTLTFRCPKAIVARQQAHAPGYRAAEGNAEGRFQQLQAPENAGATAGDWSGWNAADLQAALPRPDGTIAVLCRNNFPLMDLAFKFIRGGIPVVVLGRDIGKNLIALCKKIAPEDQTPADTVAGLIREWEVRETQLALANDKEEKVAGIRDRAESLVACLEGSGARTAGELRAVIKQLFDRVDGKITLSTIHKAKGLEWNLVVHLDPFRLPSKYALKAARAGDRRQLQQEWNLLYVCETRTKHTLLNAKLEDFNS